MRSEFAEILTSLLNGNAGQAREQAETIQYDESYDVVENWGKICQEKLQFELAIFRQI